MKLLEMFFTAFMGGLLAFPIGVYLGYQYAEPEVVESEPTINDIADQLCLDWMRQEQNSAVAQAVAAAEEIGKEPLDIHTALVAGCPPYWEAARSLPPESFK